MKTLLLALSLTALAPAAPPPAADVLQEARTRASAEKKPILLIFHASWCGWCKKLDGYLARPAVAGVMGHYFVTTHLTVLEHGEKKALDNPGAKELYEQLQGKDAGLPYYAFLDETGKPIVNSRRPVKEKSIGESIGFPSEPEEIDWFLKMVQRAAPAITKAELKTLAGELAPEK